MSKKPVLNFVKDLFKKSPLPAGVIFKEKPSFVLAVIIYVLAILAVVVVWKSYSTASPIIVAQVTAFFKGLKVEWVEGLLNTTVNYAYLAVILIPVFFHARRELTSYTLTKNELVIKKGLLVRKESFIPVSKILTVSVHTNVLGQLAKYGTIHIDVGGYAYPIAMDKVSNPKELAGKILAEINKSNRAEEA